MARIAPLIRVFISSTFADFQPERDVLQSIVFPHLRDYCWGQGAHFLPIDLRWGISEAAMQDQRTVRICLEELHRCQETSPYFHFVALLGDRYGSRLIPEILLQPDLDRMLALLPPADQSVVLAWYALDTNAIPPVYVLRPRAQDPHRWEQDQLRLHAVLLWACQQVAVSRATWFALTASVTEQEIDAGIFQVAEPHRALCFQRTIVGMPTDARAAQWFEPDGSGRAQLADLKRRLSHMIGDQIIPFAATWAHHAPSNEHMEAFATLAEQHLRARIDAALAHDAALSHAHQPDNLQHWSFAQSRLVHFTGRRDALQRIATYLARPAAEPLIITGVSGIGKTTLLLQAAQNAQTAFPQALQLTYFIGGNTPLATLPALVRDIATRLRDAYAPADAPTISDEPVLAEEQAARFLGWATAARPVILIVDALDQLIGTNLTRWLPIPLPDHVHIVVSLLPGVDLEAARARVATAQILEVTALASEEGAALLQKWLSAAKRTLTPGQRAALLSRFTSEPSPLYWRLLFEEARQWPSWLLPPALPPDTLGVLQALFTRLEAPANHGLLLVQQVLGLFAAGKQGLTEDEVMEVLSQDPALLRQLTQTHPDMRSTERFPAVLWARLSADLEALLSEREVDGTRTIGFYHRQVDEAVRSRYLAGTLALARHSDLARFFARQSPYLTQTTAHPFALVNERMVDELAYQQAQAGEPGHLKSTLFDATFLQAAITARRTIGVLEDCALLGDDPEIRVLARVLRMSAHVLDVRPEELFNQLSGRTRDFARRLHHLPVTTQLHFWLLSHSLAPADGALLQVFAGHGRVGTCVLLPDGKQILSDSDGGTLQLWDLETATLIRVIQTHRSLTSHAILPAGRQVISTTSDFYLCVWDLATGALLQALDTRMPEYAHPASALMARHMERIGPCLALPDGQQVLCAVETPPAVQVWDLATGTVVRLVRTGLIQCCALSPNGTHLLTGADGGSLRLWDLATGDTVQVFQGHTKHVTDCFILPDGRQALSFALDGTARVWDLATGVCLRVFEAGTRSGSPHAVLPNGKQAIYPYQSALQLMDLATGESQGYLRAEGGQGSDVTACLVTPDGKRALTATFDGTMQLWDLESAARGKRPDGHTDHVMVYVILPDGRRGISASRDHTLRLWDIETQTVLRVFQGHAGPVVCCGLGTDGRHVLSGGDTTLRWWNIETGVTEHVLMGHTGPVGECTVLADGRKALSTSGDGTMRVWDLQTGALLHTLPRPEEYLVLPHGQRVLAITKDHTLQLWDVETGRAMQVYSGHTDSIRHYAVLPDGKRVMSDSSDHTLRVWDLLTGAPLQVLHLGNTRVDRCTPLPDGTGAIVAEQDGTLRVWDLTTGTTRMVYTGHSHPGLFRPIQQCMVLRDGRRVLSAASIGTDLQCWDLTTGKTLWTCSDLAGMARREYGDTHVLLAVAADEKWVYFITKPSRQIWVTVHLWDIEQGREICQWSSDVDMDYWWVLHPSKPLLILGEQSGMIHVLRVAPEPFGPSNNRGGL